MALNSVKADYLSGAPALSPFYRYPFPAPDLGQLLRDRAGFPVDRVLLVQELTEQNRGFAHSQETLANIQLLANENTFTVTTGHQLVLMGGPMYMLYKIATAIKLAEIIGEQCPDYNMVPVFWMASEDHDWEEINHYHSGFFDQVTYPGNFRGAVGRHILEPEIEAVLAEVPERFRKLYQPGQDLSTCFRRLILDLFGKYGLVVIDADSIALKQAFIPYMEAEIEGRGMGSHVEATSERLEATGYKVQILPREVNLFYMGDGGRHLLVREGDRFGTKDGSHTFSKAELLRLIRTQPRDFSPNVSMRPLYQEVLLPNLAYVGGWAETSYWMQLKDAFEAAQVSFPLLVPRMSAGMVPGEIAAELSDLGLSLEDLDQEEHVLLDRYLNQHWDDGALQQAFSRLREAYSHLVETVEGIDKPLAGMAAGQAAKSNKLIDKLDQKIRKAMRNRHPGPYQRIREIKNAWQPDHKKQERVLNFTTFSGMDADALVSLILAHRPGHDYLEQWIKLP